VKYTALGKCKYQRPRHDVDIQTI